MADNTTANYPHWTPAGAGAAENFAFPQAPGSELIAAVLKDSQRLKVPNESQYNGNYLPMWQWVPAIVPPPQSPFHVPDPYTQARSLLDYARSTVGTSQSSVESPRGTEGETHKTGR